MNKIKINDWGEIPDNFTGVANFTLSGNKYWYKNGKLHRESGPAIEYSNGIKYWYLNGSELIPIDIVNLIKNGIYLELLPFLDEEINQVLFSMRWLLEDSVIYFPYDFFVKYRLFLQPDRMSSEYNLILLEADNEKTKVKNEFQLKG